MPQHVPEIISIQPEIIEIKMPTFDLMDKFHGLKIVDVSHISNVLNTVVLSGSDHVNMMGASSSSSSIGGVDAIMIKCRPLIDRKDVYVGTFLVKSCFNMLYTVVHDFIFTPHSYGISRMHKASDLPRFNFVEPALLHEFDDMLLNPNDAVTHLPILIR